MIRAFDGNPRLSTHGNPHVPADLPDRLPDSDVTRRFFFEGNRCPSLDG
jgi:hypothetical protein